MNIWTSFHVILQGYEERRYPSVNFACTELEYTPDLESSSSWSLEKVLKWVSNKKSWKDKPESKMFMKLFRYIAGVNKQQQEVEMTVPVISKMQPLEVKTIDTLYQVSPK